MCWLKHYYFIYNAVKFSFDNCIYLGNLRWRDAINHAYGYCWENQIKLQTTIRLIENNLNPIKKLPLIVTGSDGNLLIDEFETMSNNGILTPASRGANEQATYMITQVNYSISNYFLSFLAFFLFFIDLKIAPWKRKLEIRTPKLQNWNEFFAEKYEQQCQKIHNSSCC